VAVCLKILCFAIWMTIMMVLIHGSKQRKSASPSQRLCMPLNEDDEIGKPRDIFYQINPWLELSLGINSK
jgi:hypothetical protein